MVVQMVEVEIKFPAPADGRLEDAPGRRGRAGRAGPAAGHGAAEGLVVLLPIDRVDDGRHVAVAQQDQVRAHPPHLPAVLGEGEDLHELMLRGASDEELVAFIRSVVARKEERHHIGEPDFVPASRTMVHIGG